MMVLLPMSIFGVIEGVRGDDRGRDHACARVLPTAELDPGQVRVDLLVALASSYPVPGPGVARVRSCRTRRDMADGEETRWVVGSRTTVEVL